MPSSVVKISRDHQGFQGFMLFMDTHHDAFECTRKEIITQVQKAVAQKSPRVSGSDACVDLLTGSCLTKHR
eukprot:scaffold76712_cov18-Tisochrysis_lutea.AAC.1